MRFLNVQAQKEPPPPPRPPQRGIVGLPSPGNIEEIDNRKLIIDEISIFGSRANPNVSARLLSMISSGLLDINRYITHFFSMDDYEKAFDYFANRKDGALKVIIQPNP